jgi:hypothetical protein
MVPIYNLGMFQCFHGQGLLHGGDMMASLILYLHSLDGFPGYATSDFGTCFQCYFTVFFCNIDISPTKP